jgi:hypothetical protein
LRRLAEEKPCFASILHRHVSIDASVARGRYLIHPRLEIHQGGVGGLLAAFQPAGDERALMLSPAHRNSEPPFLTIIQHQGLTCTCSCIGDNVASKSRNTERLVLKTRLNLDGGGQAHGTHAAISTLADVVVLSRLYHGITHEGII